MTEEAEDPDTREIVLGLVIGYGNLVGALAAAATGAGVPAVAVRQVLDKLDEMNHDAMPTERVANLFAQQLARSTSALRSTGEGPKAGPDGQA